MSVDVEMGIWQKGQAVQQQILKFLSGPALPLGALSEDLRLVRVEDIGPAQIVVRTIEGRERAEQIFYILGSLVGGDNGVLVKGFESYIRSYGQSHNISKSSMRATQAAHRNKYIIASVCPKGNEIYRVDIKL